MFTIKSHNVTKPGRVNGYDVIETYDVISLFDVTSDVISNVCLLYDVTSGRQ